MTPTLVTACTSLPPEGARFALGRPVGETWTPTLVTACTSLPPEGAAPPAARQSRFRGRYLGGHQSSALGSLRTLNVENM